MLILTRMSRDRPTRKLDKAKPLSREARLERRRQRIARVGERHEIKLREVLGEVNMPESIRTPGHHIERKLDYYELIFTMALCGMTDKQICRALCIDEAKLIEWSRKDGEILTALQQGRDLAVAYLSKCLFMRAKGYSHPEEVLKYDTRAHRWRRAWTMKHYPPDTGAIMSFLTNRAPELWSNRSEVDVKNSDGSLAAAWEQAVTNKRSAPAEIGASEKQRTFNGIGH